MALPEAESVSVPPPGRVVVPILAVGGLFSFLTLAVPDYVASGTGPRLVVAVEGLLCLAAAAACYRYGVTPTVMMLLALLADLAATLSVYTLPAEVAGRTSPALFALPGVVMALYGTRRMLALQLVAAAAGTTTMLVAMIGLNATAVTQALTTWLAITGPCVAVWVLRSRLERSVQQERQRSVTDPLTLVGNRRAVDSLAAGLFARVHAGGEALGVAVVDVDHFKRINDRHGHRVGDRIILEVSRALTDAVREDDLVVRLGGEEFAVFALLPGDELAGLGERIRTTVASRCAAQGVTVSVGVTSHGRDSASPADPVEALWQLVEEADGLMYTAKREGRNRVRTDLGRQPGPPVTGATLPA